MNTDSQHRRSIFQKGDPPLHILRFFIWRRSIIKPLIFLSCHYHLIPLICKYAFQFTGYLQIDFLFLQSVKPHHSRIRSPVSGIDRNDFLTVFLFFHGSGNLGCLSGQKQKAHQQKPGHHKLHHIFFQVNTSLNHFSLNIYLLLSTNTPSALQYFFPRTFSVPPSAF